MLKNNFDFLCKRNGSKRSLLRNRYLVSSRDVLSRKREIEGVVSRDQTTAASKLVVILSLRSFPLQGLDLSDLRIAMNHLSSSFPLLLFSCIQQAFCQLRHA